MSKVIKMRNLTPYYYTTSRDYQVILNLLDLLINSIKTDIDSIPDNLDPYKCNELLLELLASFVGYDYDYSMSFDSNRLVIDNYITMIRNRGNILGIKMATALCFNGEQDLDKVENLNMFSVDYVQEDNLVAIYVYYPKYMKQIRNMVERTRPIRSSTRNYTCI